MRDIVRLVLERKGYEVIEALDGEDAVEKFRKHRDRIQLFLTDVVMPKKDGREAYDEIRKTHPGVKVLFISGYSDMDTQEYAEDGQRPDFVSKPVEPDDLLRRVRDILDA